MINKIEDLILDNSRRAEILGTTRDSELQKFWILSSNPNFLQYTL